MSSYLLIMLVLLACAAPGPDAPVGELVEVVAPPAVVPTDRPLRTVEVRGQRGTPIPDAEIVIAAPTPWGAWALEEPGVRTDATGHAMVYATEDAKLGARLDGGVIGVGGDVITVEHDSVLVEGIVADDDGRPLPGATVRGTTSRWASGSGKDPLKLLDEATGTVTADTNGIFRFRHRVAGDTRLYLTATAPGHVHTRTDFVVLPGQTLWHRFEVAPGQLVALRCAGLPDSSCASVAANGETRCDGNEEVRRTRVDGVVHLGIVCPVGAADVTLDDLPGAWSASGETAWFDFREWTGGVAGRVSRHDGCTLRLDASRSFVEIVLGPDYPSRDIEVGADGAFRVVGLGPGAWRLRGCGAKGEVVEVGDAIVDLGTIE